MSNNEFTDVSNEYSLYDVKWYLYKWFESLWPSMLNDNNTSKYLIDCVSHLNHHLLNNTLTKEELKHQIVDIFTMTLLVSKEEDFDILAEMEKSLGKNIYGEIHSNSIDKE